VSWRLRWSFAAIAGLRALPWRDAAKVDAAVLRLARSGEGDLDLEFGDLHGARLRVDRYLVRVEIEPAAKAITV
jgi:hypothetical protein